MGRLQRRSVETTPAQEEDGREISMLREVRVLIVCGAGWGAGVVRMGHSVCRPPMFEVRSNT